jgi:hypothetical protein
MRELDMVLQSGMFHGSGPPRWAFFHRLGLQFGWGPGLRETLGDQLGSIRSVFVIADRDDTALPGQLGDYLDWVDEHDRSLPPLPFYLRILRQGKVGCACLHANAFAGGLAGPKFHSPHDDAAHGIEASDDYRVTHGVDAGGRIELRLEKRKKKIKPEFGGKTGELSRLKLAYRTERVAALTADRSAVPERFHVEMARLLRIRHREVLQGKRDWRGELLPPYTGEELLDRTVQVIADMEASSLAFDYTWTPVAHFSETGLTML